MESLVYLTKSVCHWQSIESIDCTFPCLRDDYLRSITFGVYRLSQAPHYAHQHLCNGELDINKSSRDYIRAGRLSESYTNNLFVCLFVLGFFVPLENRSLIWRCHHHRWQAANFDLCSALVAIAQWVFFSVPDLLWHGSSVNNGHHRGPVTLAHISERLAVELSLPVFTT